MKLEDVFFFGGLVFIGYWLTKKNATIIPSETMDIKSFVPEPLTRTIVLDLKTKSKPSNLFDEKFVRDYNTSIESTISPQKIHVKREL
jgi:hypothetical protein